MKSEKEIRQHMEDLKVCLEMPCNCAVTGHAIECEGGRRMMQATIGTLSWLLGENPELQKMVNWIHNDVVAFRRVN